MRETTMRFQFIRYGVLCALLAWTSPVEAGGGCTDEKFQRHSKHALEAYNRGDYETALVHYDKGVSVPTEAHRAVQPGPGCSQSEALPRSADFLPAIPGR
jgi:hypothetical protein